MNSYRNAFASHAHANNEVCDRYVHALRARGIDIWYDRNNMQAGHFIDREIEQQLEQRSAFVLLLTQEALDSYWVQQELGAYRGLAAKERARLILPVRIGPCAVPTLLNALLWIDAQAMPFEQAIDAIASALTMHSGATVQPPVVTPPPRETLPPLGPAPTPANSVASPVLATLHSLGFRGYSVKGVECILPPLCPVPAGGFTMGSDKNRDKQASDDETPQYQIEVDGFALGQHPVTVAEYACLVRANAVREPPEFFGVTWETQQAHPDYPVVCASWQDVVAYCAWLAKTTRQHWRLPTEAEWEKAARGTDGRIYPWGDTFDKARCNTSESGIKTTTPVGRYPSGESPYHVQDMAGNVWEWTSSLYKPYPYIHGDGREAANSTEDRVLHGGSWNYDPRDARAAFRHHGRLAGLVYGRGFRLVLAWPGSA